jgi:raw score 16.02
MNLNAKVALSLILGASTLLSACDNKENTSTQVEKAVRVPAPTEKAESAVEKSKGLVAETKSAEKVAEKTESTEVKADAKKADVKSDAVKAEVKKEAKADDVVEKVSEKKETVVAQQVATAQKPRVVVTEKAPKESTERKQQRAVLNVLEKQYEEVRCSADAKNLSGDSFCRQEERRLFLEIQRIKDELRGIEE